MSRLNGLVVVDIMKFKRLGGMVSYALDNMLIIVITLPYSINMICQASSPVNILLLLLLLLLHRVRKEA